MDQLFLMYGSFFFFYLYEVCSFNYYHSQCETRFHYVPFILIMLVSAIRLKVLNSRCNVTLPCMYLCAKDFRRNLIKYKLRAGNSMWNAMKREARNEKRETRRF